MARKIASPKKSHELIEAETQVFQLTQTIESMFYVTLNAHIDLKQEWGPESILGEAYLYELLKRFGKCGLSEDQKEKILEEVTFLYPEDSEKGLLEMCKVFGYNKFLQDMVDFGKKLNARGQIIDHD